MRRRSALVSSLAPTLICGLMLPFLVSSAHPCAADDLSDSQPKEISETLTPLGLSSQSAIPEVHADETDPIAARIRQAGRACTVGDSEAAARLLGEIRVDLGRRYGEAHSVTRIVELSLDQLERNLGESTQHPEIPKSANLEEEVPEAIDHALKSLRPCVAMMPSTTPPLLLDDSHAPPHREVLTLEEAGFETHLQAARAMAAKGQYRAAVVAARRAQDLAGRRQTNLEKLEAFSALALLRLQVGDVDGAVAAAEQADELARSEQALASRIAMARVFAQAQHLEEAREILAQVEAATRLDPRAAAELHEARGDLDLRLGAPGRALDALDAALAAHRERFGDTHPATGNVHQLRGNAHRMSGDLPAAKRDYARAMAIRESVFGAGHPETARSLNALGVLHSDYRDWAAADRDFQRALASLTEEFGVGHPEVVTVRANRALVAWEGSSSAAAAADYALVVRDLARVYGEDHPIVSEARRNLARMEESLGRRDQAESLLDLALTAQLRSLGARHPALAPTRLARGRFYARSGRFEEAEAELGAAVEVLNAHYGDEHPLVARARVESSRVATLKGAPDVAWQQAREAARVFSLHLNRSFGAMPDRERSLLARDSDDVVGALFSAKGVPAREVYVAHLPQRDSVLRSIAATRASARSSTEASREVLAELEELRVRYVASILSQSPRSAERARTLAREIDAQETLVALAQGILRPLEAREVLHRACRQLPADASVVEFVAYDRFAASQPTHSLPSYAALIMRPAASGAQQRDCRVLRVELGAAEPIDAAADAFALAMREQRSDATEVRARLGELLLEPLRKSLAGSPRWLVIPDAALWGVPLSALPDPENPKRYLAERVTSGTLTSLHELAEFEPGVAGDARLAGALLFGAPAFGQAKPGGGPIILTQSGPCRLDPFEPLPGTERELSEIRALMPEPRVVLGSEATKDRFRSELAAHPSILHLATHAYFAGRDGCASVPPPSAPSDQAIRSSAPLAPNPLMLSGIVFAGANDSQRLGEGQADERASSILTAYEAAGLDLSASRLVVLSACDTGTGLNRRGQEIQGLRWGFRAAGAQSLVTSLWRSNDVVTRKLMHGFYRALGSGDLREDLFLGAEALRQAQLARVEREKRLGLKNPLSWANFVFSGVY